MAHSTRSIKLSSRVHERTTETQASTAQWDAGKPPRRLPHLPTKTNLFRVS